MLHQQREHPATDRQRKLRVAGAALLLPSPIALPAASATIEGIFSAGRAPVSN